VNVVDVLASLYTHMPDSLSNTLIRDMSVIK